MAVLVKDMEMPTACFDCQIRYVQFGMDFCQFSNTGRPLTNIYDMRQAFCPLVEIPKVKALMTDNELEEAGFEL